LFVKKEYRYFRTKPLTQIKKQSKAKAHSKVGFCDYSRAAWRLMRGQFSTGL